MYIVTRLLLECCGLELRRSAVDTGRAVDVQGLGTRYKYSPTAIRAQALSPSSRHLCKYHYESHMPALYWRPDLHYSILGHDTQTRLILVTGATAGNV
jgi:hypothetical protein